MLAVAGEIAVVDSISMDLGSETFARLQPPLTKMSGLKNVSEGCKGGIDVKRLHATESLRSLESREGIR